MGLGVTTGGTGGELSVEFARALVLLLRDALSVSLSEAAEVGREIVSTEEVRRMTLPMRADHFGLGLELLMAEESGRWLLLRKRGWERPEASWDVYYLPNANARRFSRGISWCRYWIKSKKMRSAQTRCIRETIFAYKIHVVPCSSLKT